MGWQLSTRSLLQRVSHLYKSGTFSDVLFIVGSPPAMRVIPAHKVLFAAASSIFAQMLYHSGSEVTTKVITDVDPDTFDVIVRYVYTDQAYFTCVQQAWLVLMAAQRFQLPGLQEKCCLFLNLCQ